MFESVLKNVSPSYAMALIPNLMKVTIAMRSAVAGHVRREKKQSDRVYDQLVPLVIIKNASLKKYVDRLNEAHGSYMLELEKIREEIKVERKQLTGTDKKVCKAFTQQIKERRKERHEKEKASETTTVSTEGESISMAESISRMVTMLGGEGFDVEVIDISGNTMTRSSKAGQSDQPAEPEDTQAHKANRIDESLDKSPSDDSAVVDPTREVFSPRPEVDATSLPEHDNTGTLGDLLKGEHRTDIEDSRKDTLTD